jgi:hypothetical protein
MKPYDRWRITSEFGLIAALMARLHLPTAVAQSTDCATNSSQSVAESTARGMSTLHDMLHRPAMAGRCETKDQQRFQCHSPTRMEARGRYVSHSPRGFES